MNLENDIKLVVFIVGGERNFLVEKFKIIFSSYVFLGNIEESVKSLLYSF